MKINAIRKALWAADALLVVGLLFAVNRAFSAAGPAAEGPDGGSLIAPPAAQAVGEDEARRAAELIAPAPAQQTGAQGGSGQDAITVATDFEYKVVGTVVHPPVSFAVFAAPGTGVQTVVSAGEKIGDAAVVAVEEYGVLLERGGQIFKVNLEERKLPQTGGAQVARSQPYIPQTSTRPVIPPEFQTGAETAATGEEEGEEYTEEEEDLDAMIIPLETFKEYLQNLGKYINELVVLSHYDDNKQLDGLLLARVPETSEAYKRGLREGDIVTSIQDVPITDTSVVGKVGWDLLDNEDYIVNVVIIRNGEEEILTYEIWPE